jgi:hypothetical protein
MHLRDDGYIGVSPLPDGLTNVCVVRTLTSRPQSVGASDDDSGTRWLPTAGFVNGSCPRTWNRRSWLLGRCASMPLAPGFLVHCSPAMRPASSTDDRV